MNGNDSFTIDGEQYTIEGDIGDGAQGWVKKVRCADGTDKALKLYKPKFLRDLDTSTQPGVSIAAFRENLHHLVRRAEQGKLPEQRFLWPEAMVSMPLTTASGVRRETFGYIMPLCGSDYMGVAELINLGRRSMTTGFASLTAMCNALLGLCVALEDLHTSGLSFQDLNPNGVAVRPDTGDILIMDCDNVTTDRHSVTTIVGFRGYQAPEVVRGERPASSSNDAHALATLLFELMMKWHPMEGRRLMDTDILTEEFQAELYSTHPVFVFDPTNTSNRPEPEADFLNVNHWWRFFPAFIHRAFQRTFSQACLTSDDPTSLPAGTGRLTENEWVKLLLRLRRCICRCPHCGREQFADPQRRTQQCAYRNCEQEFQMKALRFSGCEPIAICAGKRIYRSDTGDANLLHVFDAIGGFVAKKNDASSIALKCADHGTWRVQPSPDSDFIPLTNNKVVQLRKGALWSNAMLSYDDNYAVIDDFHRDGNDE